MIDVKFWEIYKTESKKMLTNWGKSTVQNVLMKFITDHSAVASIHSSFRVTHNRDRPDPSWMAPDLEGHKGK